MRRHTHLALALLVILALHGCASTAPDPAETAAEPFFEILAINDVYRIEGVDDRQRGGMARLRTLRAQLEAENPNLLFLHAGDFLAPSLASRVFQGEQMVDAMNRLDGDPQAFDERFFVTFGNHEFDLKDAATLDRRIAESQFRWLGTNLWIDEHQGVPLLASENRIGTALIDIGGMRVGLFSLTDESAQPSYILDFYDRNDTALSASTKLRAAGAEVVIALTHLAADEDRQLYWDLGDNGPDLIIGGHDHHRMAIKVGDRWILKADADARTAVHAKVFPQSDGPPRVESRFLALGPEQPEPDPDVETAVADWNRRVDEAYCQDRLGMEPGCLDQVVGNTRVVLTAEELSIRRFETNLGNWIADRMIDHFRPAAPEGFPLVAFVNSGSLRLNQDLPANRPILRRHIEELFAYPAEMRLLRIDGKTLKEVASRGVESWTGNGWWLQISGFAYVHEPENEKASHLTLLPPDGPARPIEDDETLYAVTVDYLVNDQIGDQDGYVMLLPRSVASTGVDLHDYVLYALAKAGSEGIAPEIEGRICNTEKPGPCLAITP
ncbi:MAG: metallophosphoesterase [Acidobacteriota bacterium]